MSNYADKEVKINGSFAEAVYKQFVQDRFGITMCGDTDYEKYGTQLELCNWDKTALANGLDMVTLRKFDFEPIYYNTSVIISDFTTGSAANAPITTTVDYQYGTNGTQSLITVNSGGNITNITVNPEININRNNEFTFEQLVASCSWLVTHNFGFVPNVYTTNLQGQEIEGVVTPVDANTIQINFSEDVAGYAYLS
jgi:hypothetical protein